MKIECFLTTSMVFQVYLTNMSHIPDIVTPAKTSILVLILPLCLHSFYLSMIFFFVTAKITKYYLKKSIYKKIPFQIIPAHSLFFFSSHKQIPFLLHYAGITSLHFHPTPYLFPLADLLLL